MIIRELRIESFGVLQDVALQGLGPGVQVVYGHNEAGKTTLLEFIRGVVFGFASRARYVCNGEQVLSGRLICDVRGKPLTLARRFSISEGESHEIHWNEQRLSDSEFRELLSGFDEGVFCSVFAITLDELARLRTLDETQAADQFYDLSLGLDRTAVQRLFADIENRRKTLLNPATQAGEIPHLIAERRRLDREVEEASQITEEYARLRRTRDELLRAKASEEASAGELTRRLETLRTLDALAPQRERMQELRTLIENHPRSEVALPVYVTKVRRERKRLLRLTDRLRTLSARRRELEHDLSQIPPARALLSIAPAVEGIRLSLPAIRQWIDEMEACRREMAALAEQRRAIEAELSAELRSENADRGTYAETGDAGEERPVIKRPRLGSAWTRHVDRLRREIREIVAQLREMKRRLRTLQEEHERIAAGLRDRADGMAAEEVAREIQRLGDRLAKLRRWEQVRVRLHEVEEHREATRRELLKHLPEELTLQQNVALGGTFVAGLSLLLATGLGALGVPSFSGLSWIWGLVGGIAAATVPPVRSRLLAQAGKVRAETMRRLETVEGELRGLKSEQARLEAELAPLPERPAEAVPGVERRLRELQDLRDGMDEERAAAQAVAECRKQGQALCRRLRVLLGKWQELLTSGGISGNPSPQRWPVWRRRLREVATLDKKESELAKRLPSLVERLAEVESRLEELAKNAGISMPDGSPEDKIRFLAGRIEEAVNAREERRRIHRVLSSARREWKKCRSLRAKSKLRLKRLYRRVGVASYSELRAKIEEEERRSALREELERLAALWQSTVGGIGDTELRELASLSVAEVRQAMQALQAELEARRHRFAELLERLGRVSAQVESLTADRSPQLRALEWAGVESQTVHAVRDWWMLSLGQKVLERVRLRYQKERQPALLQEASEYWRRMTGGRFVRVWTPLEERVLLAEDREGRSYGLDQLSRGTREQLFLCLRLALASHFGRRFEPIPLILDDVLVNFDQVRAESACHALLDFAGEGRQVLLFTCHDHVAGVFASAGAAVCRLQDRPEEEQSRLRTAVERESQVAEPRPSGSELQSGRKKARKNRPVIRADQTSLQEAVSESTDSGEEFTPSETSPKGPAQEGAEEWFAVPEPYPIEGAANSEKASGGRRSTRLQGRRNKAA
ncbi:ATP-binding protein [Thermopirellula anaerolimosa]